MISKLTRLPIVLANAQLYRPEYAESGPDYDLIADEIVNLKQAAQCSTCGYIIAAGSIARSRTELRVSGLHRFKWCEQCDMGTISMRIDGRVLSDQNFLGIEAELSDAEEVARGTEGTTHEQIDELLVACRCVGAVLDGHRLAFAADDTLHQRALNVRKTLQNRVTAITKAAFQMPTTDHYATDGFESVDNFMRRTGIIHEWKGSFALNLDSLAECLDVDGKTAQTLSCYPEVLKDVVTAFLKLKRAA